MHTSAGYDFNYTWANIITLHKPLHSFIWMFPHLAQTHLATDTFVFWTCMLSNSQVFLGSLWSCIIKRAPSSSQRLSYWLDQMTAAVVCAFESDAYQNSLTLTVMKRKSEIKRAIFRHFMYIMSFWVLIINSFGWKEKNISHFFSFMVKLQRTGVNISRHVLQETPQILPLTCLSVCVCVCVCEREREREREGVCDADLRKQQKSHIYIYTEKSHHLSFFS